MKESPTARLVKEKIESNSLLEGYLREGLINIAALSRTLLPEIKKENPRATLESISVAIQRLKFESHTNETLSRLIKNVQLSSRTGMCVLIVSRKSALPSHKEFSRDDIYVIHHGIEQTTVLIDEKNLSLFESQSTKRGMGILNIRDTLGLWRTTPGFLDAFVNALSSKGINIVDIFTGKNGLRMVVSESDLPRAYEACLKVKKRS